MDCPSLYECEFLGKMKCSHAAFSVGKEQNQFSDWKNLENCWFILNKHSTFVCWRIICSVTTHDGEQMPIIRPGKLGRSRRWNSRCRLHDRLLKMFAKYYIQTLYWTVNEEIVVAGSDDNQLLLITHHFLRKGRTKLEEFCSQYIFASTIKFSWTAFRQFQSCLKRTFELRMFRSIFFMDLPASRLPFKRFLRRSLM